MNYLTFCAVILLTTAANGRGMYVAPDLHDYDSAPIRSLQMSVHVIQENQDELDKIEGDFAQAYRFHNLSFSYVQPGKLHYETVVLGAHIAYTINGDKKLSSIPTFHVHKVEDVSGAPGKKQNLLDVGLVSPEILDDYNFVYIGKKGGDLLFNLQSKMTSESSYDVLWIDPTTHITVHRFHYDRDRRLDKSFVYANPVQVAPNTYVPSRVEVYNQYGKLAAVSVYSDIKVNTPIDESLFDF